MVSMGGVGAFAPFFSLVIWPPLVLGSGSRSSSVIQIFSFINIILFEIYLGHGRVATFVHLVHLYFYLLCRFSSLCMVITEAVKF